MVTDRQGERYKQGEGEGRTAAMRSTSNRLLRMKQASASSILQAVSTACGPAAQQEREDRGAMRREDMRGRKEALPCNY